MASGAAAILASASVREVVGQEATPAWSPADGLRLAGPAGGLMTLDPAVARDFQEMSILRQVFRGLLGYSTKLETVPDLAASVTASEDVRVFAVALRPGIAFHDGRAITSRDVHDSFVRALNPATAGGDASGLSAAIYLGGIVGAADVLAGTTTTLAGFAISSDATFEIHLTGADSAFPQKLASVPAAIVDASTAGTGGVPNGTGPFRVDSFVPNSALALSASSRWYEGAPEITSLSYRLGAGAGNPLNLYQAGEIDILDGIADDQMELLADPASGASLGDVTKTNLFSLYYLALGSGQPPLDDVHVRRALQLAFPAAKFAAAGGATVTPARGFIPPGMLGEQWSATLPAMNLDAARSELRKSRYARAADVPPITIYGGQGQGAGPLRNVGVAMRDVVGAELGLTIEPVWIDWNDYLLGLPQGLYPTYSITWVADYPDPESMLWVLFGSDSSENYSGYRNDAFDALLASARAEPDDARRASIYTDAQQVLIDDAVVMPFFFDISYTVARPGIAGVPASAIGMLGLESVRKST
ncbi:MAG TPA: ABC transporter substrate-binding protein [Thermomicrobiales bacterium]|nr:ABC transporter substrate-binding protein [Thermomicrobiales bacterium]